MAKAAFFISALLLVALVVVISTTYPQPSETELKSTVSTAAISQQHRQAATSAAETAQEMRRKAEAAEAKIENDKLDISRDSTQLHRFQRKLNQDKEKVSKSMQFDSQAGDEKVQDLVVQEEQLEKRIKEYTPRITKAKKRVERRKAELAKDRLRIKNEKEKRAELLAEANIIGQKQKLAAKHAKTLRERSDRDFKLATTPGKVGWNYYADHGASLMNEAKIVQEEAVHLAAEADNDRIDASLLGGANGHSSDLAALKRAKEELKFAQKHYDRVINKRGGLMERLAAARTRLAAAQMESQAIHKDASIASSAAQSIQVDEGEIKHRIRELKDQIDELNLDESSNARLKEVFMRRAKNEATLSQTQFQEMEQN